VFCSILLLIVDVGVEMLLYFHYQLFRYLNAIYIKTTL
jgi:hypothetical protein